MVWAKLKVAQSCWSLCDPMDYSPTPSSSVHGILQARILEWVAFPFSRGLFLTQGWNPGLLYCRQILYHLSHRGYNLFKTKTVVSLVKFTQVFRRKIKEAFTLHMIHSHKPSFYSAVHLCPSLSGMPLRPTPQSTFFYFLPFPPLQCITVM